MPDPKNITETTSLGELREQLQLLDGFACSPGYGWSKKY